MSGKLIISVSGLRGIVGESLTPAVAADFAAAFGTYLQSRHPGAGLRMVCVGRDSRPSGRMLAEAAAAGLSATGIDVVDIGLVTTPSAGIMTRHLGCVGGLVVTASHNPIEYNGIKCLLGNGAAPDAETAMQIRELFENRRLTFVDSVGVGDVCTDDRTDSIHLEKVLSILDPELISRRKFKVVLDSVNGAGGRIGGKFLGALGCEATFLNAEPSGRFAHPPEPVAENLTDLCARVNSAGADIGFAQDPDADRLAIVDEKGKYIGEEYTLALAAKYIFSKCKGTAAANLSTSRMIDDVASAAGCSVIRTPVGEANVVKAMLDNDCIIGGEGNGGVIDLRVGCIRDSLVAMGLVLQLMAETGKTVSSLAAEIPRYDMVKDKFAADEELAGRVMSAARNEFADARLNSSDGCRFDFDDGWVHLRASNTEPVMRVIAEAADAEVARRYVNNVLQIRDRLKAEKD